MQVFFKSKPTSVSISDALHVVIGWQGEVPTRNRVFSVVFEEPSPRPEVKPAVFTATSQDAGYYTIEIRPCSLAPIAIRHITMDEKPIPESDFRVRVTRTYRPDLATVPLRVFGVNRGPIEFEDPWGLAVDDRGRLFVTDSKKQHLYVIDSDLATCRRLECQKDEGREPYPRGLVFIPDKRQLVAVCSGQGKMQVFNVADEVTYITSCGNGVGDAAGQFTNPRGACLCPGGDIAVVDSDNCRIQIYGPDGNYNRTIGEKGREGGKLFYPASVAHRKAPGGEDQLVVTDCDNYCVKVYNFGTGAHVHTIDREGEGWKFNGPSGVCVDPFLGTVFISDYRDHCVFVFDEELKFVAKLGGPTKLNGPRGIAVDAKGNLFVADMGNHRLVKF